MTENRRHAERIPYPCEVDCTLLDGLAIGSTRFSDLSVEGAFVESLNELPVGTLLHLRFQLGEREVDTLGRIVQVMPGFGFGVHFERILPADVAALRAFVAQAG
jgi:hypothetical protein